MRIHEILVETSEENQIVNLLTSSLTKTIGGMIRGKIPDFDKNPDVDYSGIDAAGYTIGQLHPPHIDLDTITKPLDTLKIVLRFEPHRSTDLDMGGYAPKSNAIILNIPDIKTFSAYKKKSFDDVIQQTMAHELQHAIDYAKSGGAAFSKPARSSGDDFEEYLNMPHEINARFTEAILEISRVISGWKEQGVTDVGDDLVKLIKRTLTDNRLDKIGPEKLKRLYSRVYKFYQSELTNPKELKPDTMASKAKNWILGKKTSGTIS